MGPIFPQNRWSIGLAVAFLFLLVPLTSAFTNNGRISTNSISNLLIQDPALVGRRTLVAYLTEKGRKSTSRKDSASCSAAKKNAAALPKSAKKYRRPRSIALIPLDEGDDHYDDPVAEHVVVAETPVEKALDHVTTVVDEHAKNGHVESAAIPVTIENHSVEPSTAAEDIQVPEPPIALEESAKDSTMNEKTGSDRVDWYTMDTIDVSTTAVEVLKKSLPYYAQTQESIKMNQEEVDRILSQFTNSVNKDETVDHSNVPETTSLVEHSITQLSHGDLISNLVARVEEENEQICTPTPPKEEPPTGAFTDREWDANVVCAEAFAAVEQHPILLFDGACNLCNGWVNFCLDYDVQALFRFASLQSKVGQSILIRDGRPPDDRSDIILATPQETYAKSDAVLRVVSQLEGLPIFLRVAATMVRLVLPTWFRDAVYKFIGAHRHMWGDTDGPVCRLDLDGEYIGRFIEDPDLEEYDENLASESEAEVFVTRRQ